MSGLDGPIIDVLVGGGGDDLLKGGGENDYLQGGLGTDHLIGDLVWSSPSRLAPNWHRQELGRSSDG